jgi:hypothetical protein
MTGTDGLEWAIRDWACSFETGAAGESKPIRLSADSVALHRVKGFGSERLWYVTCESSSHPEQGRWAWSGWAIKSESGGWTVSAIGGSGGHPLLTGRPWVNLGIQFLDDGFRAAGWVEDAGLDITDVRLIDSAGFEVIDQIESQVALFRADRSVELPLSVHLIDATGAVAAFHQLP